MKFICFLKLKNRGNSFALPDQKRAVRIFGRLRWGTSKTRREDICIKFFQTVLNDESPNVYNLLTWEASKNVHAT